MSEADTARLLLAELEATELVLRQLAVENLPYAGVLAVERRAFERCRELLAAVGFQPVTFAPAPAPAPRAPAHEESPREATEELLTGGPTAVPGPQSGVRDEPVATPAHAAPAFASFEALDEGPEGVADEGNDLRSEESASGAEPEVLPEISDLEPLDDEDEEEKTAEGPADLDFEEPVFSDPRGFEPDIEDATEPAQRDHDDPADEDPTGRHDLKSVLAAETALSDTHFDRAGTPPGAGRRAPGGRGLASDLEDGDTEPEPSSDEAYVSYVRYEEDPAPASPRLPSFDGAGVESDDGPTLGNTRAKAHDAFANLVSFDAPPEEEVDPEALDVDAAPLEDEEEPIRAPAPTPAGAEGRNGRPAVLSDVGADALVTMEEHATVLMGDALAQRSEEELEELELDDPDSFDLMPDLSDEVAEADEPTMVRAAGASAQPGSSRTPSPAPSMFGTPGPSPTSSGPRPTPRPAAAAAAAAPRPSTPIGGGGTGGLYGGGSVPTIRDSDDPRPRAAAIQLNSGGQGGRVIGLEEEEEPIEIGAAEDYGEDEAEAGGGGFSLQVQEYEEEEYEEEPEPVDPEDEEVIEPKQPEIPAGPTAEEIRALFEQAQTVAANGDLQAGADLFSDLIDQDPDNIDAHVARGRLYLDLGDYSRAMSDFMVAEDLGPENPEPQVAIGDLYFARKDYRKAIDYFNIALEFSPNHAMAHCRRGISHYYRKNYPEAVADLLRAQKLDPEIPNIQTYVSMAKKKSK